MRGHLPDRNSFKRGIDLRIRRCYLFATVNGTRIRALVAAALVLTAALASAPAGAGGRYRSRSVKVRRGLTLTRMLDRVGPNRIRVLTVNVKTPLALDVALANDSIPDHERTSAMARRHGAIAAINGDFTIPPGNMGAGRPVDTFAEDGRLIASPLIWGRNFSISADETEITIGHSPLRVVAHQPDGDGRFKVNTWSEWPPKKGEVAGYIPAGGSTFPPPRRACAARLYPASGQRWGKDGVGLSTDHVVDVARCSKRRLGRRGGVVIAAPRGTEEGARIRDTLVPGELVRLSWALGRRPNVLDTIGGNPTLIEDGAIVVEHCSAAFCRRHPRSGVGVTGKGKVLLVTVDGRQPGYSVGMTPVQFARLFRRLGATWALNLDGGGSTTLWVDGRIVNRPSDPGGERSVGSSLLVLKERDRGDPSPRQERARKKPRPKPKPKRQPPLGHFAVHVDPKPSPASCVHALDPASTGGMLDAVDRGELGPRQRVTGPLRDTVETFRGQSPCRSRPSF